MPLPRPNTGEKERPFIDRCMSTLADEYKDHKQRAAICYGLWRDSKKKKKMGTRATRTEGGHDFPAAAFAYVPDKANPKTWSIRVWESPQKMTTPRQVRAAIKAWESAELPSDVRSKVKAKLRKAWLLVHPDKTRDDLPAAIRSTVPADERRCWGPVEELRIMPGGEGEPTRLVGLAVPYNRNSIDLGGFTEIVEPGAFAEALASGRDMRADVEHDRSKLLGRTSTSTLLFEDGPDGLRATITLPNTQLGKDTAEEVRSRLRDAMSVSWEARGIEDDFTEDGEHLPVRHIKKANLTGVAVTAFPAYEQTAGKLALRSLSEYLNSQDDEDESGDDETPPADNTTLRLRLDLAEAL